MELKIEISGIQVLTLGQLKPGEVFSFIDSGDYPGDLSIALVSPAENLFMVFSDGGDKSGGEDVEIVSLDGQIILRRSASRVISRVERPIFCQGDKARGSPKISNLDPGAIVFVGGSFFMVVKVTPPRKGKVSLVSIDGTAVVSEVDDDLCVESYPGAHFVVTLGFA